MVYNSQTYELCHKLAPEAECLYKKILEDAATEMLLRHQHPVKWLIGQLKELFA